MQFDSSMPKQKAITNNAKKELTAIIVDDDINLLNLTTEILKQNNYKVIPFSNGADAIDAARTNSYDFIIT
ncbi:MAG: hypothetical protein PSX42_12335, partial [bacterium]|nr:hypothetical protein [bacterium]